MASVKNLTINDILTIQQRVAAGEFQHVIAADYGLNQGRISEIVHGTKYQHLTQHMRHPLKRQLHRKPHMRVGCKHP